MTTQTKITLYNLDHIIFKKQENFEMRCYTVLWKWCMVDLNNVPN